MGQTFRNFKSFASSLEAIYLVEASVELMHMQKQLLCGKEAVIEEIDIGHRSKCKYFDVSVVWVQDIRLLPKRKSFLVPDGPDMLTMLDR